MDARRSESSLGGKVYLCNSGAEAVEAAIKVVRKARPRGDVVVVHGAFHGRTYGALSATPQESKQAAFAPLVPGFRVVEATAAALSEAVDERTAAVLLEPIQGETGVNVLGEDALRAARAARPRGGSGPAPGGRARAPRARARGARPRTDAGLRYRRARTRGGAPRAVRAAARRERHRTRHRAPVAGADRRGGRDRRGAREAACRPRGLRPCAGLCPEGSSSTTISVASTWTPCTPFSAASPTGRGDAATSS